MSVGAPSPAGALVGELRPWHYIHYSGRCNLSCFYCYEQRKAEPLDQISARISESLRFAGRAGYTTVVFESGELLLLPDYLELVARAARSFEQVVLLSNLTLIDGRKLGELAAAGLGAIGGTIFAFSEKEARQVAGRAEAFGEQKRALEAILAQDRISFWPHLMLTRSTTRRLRERVEILAEMSGGRTNSLVLSAIEPVNSGVTAHPQYTDALSTDWEAFLAACDEMGIFALVQNIPACRLGRFATRSFLIRKRMGRIIEGLPEDGELARGVAVNESLFGRLPPRGACIGCGLLALCQRFFEYRKKKRRKDISARRLVADLLAGEGIEFDAGEILRRLTAMEQARPGPAPG